MKKNLKILYIDDEEDILRIAKMCVESVGEFEMVTSTEAEDACELVKRENPDLIMLDMMMPKLDGLEVLTKLQKNGLVNAIPVVFVTAKIQRDDVKKYLESGAVGVVSKPFDPMNLANELEALYNTDSKETKARNILQESLNSIKRTYVESLKERIDVLVALQEVCSTGNICDFDLVEVSNCVHKLAGSGTTFGYPEISRIAHEIELLLLDGKKPCDEKVIELTRQLISECKSAEVSL